ncbi:MAG: prolyl oligopeptidase family serine peptidase [Pseudomonadota bacterium]
MKLYTLVKGLAASALTACAMLAPAAMAQEDGFTPLEHFIRDPAFVDADVSPDGTYLATVQRLEKDGNPLILVFETADLSKPPVVFGSAEKVKIRSVDWLDDDTLVSAMWQIWDSGNEYNNQFVKLATISMDERRWEDLPKRRFDRRSQAERDFGQYNSGSIISTMPWDPDKILVAYNQDITRPANIYEMDVDNGSLDLVGRGVRGGDVGLYGRDGTPRLKQTVDGDDIAKVYLRRNGDAEWTLVKETAPTVEAVAEIFQPVAQDTDNASIFYVVSNHEFDTAGLYKYDLASEEFLELLFHHPDYDAAGVQRVWRPDTKSYEIVGYSYAAAGFEIEYISPEEKTLADAIDLALPNANNSIISRSEDEKYIVISSQGPQMPPSYFLLTDKAQLDYLGSANPDLQPAQLANVTWEYYTARDGREMPALITRPNGEGPWPVVMMPHGGPVARDFWGFDLWAQTLASRGYLVVQPQFRISSGFGKDHMMSGFKRWGYEPQDDVDDALAYVVELGLGIEEEAAIFGWSYGGYSAFVGSMREDNVYQCAIPGAGVSEKARFRSYLAQIGDFSDRTYRPTADGFDPLAHVDKVNVPVLVIHGEIDERVPIIHSELFVDELKRHNKEHRYVVLEDANHFFGTIFYDNYQEMFTEMFAFLEGPCGMPPRAVNMTAG